MVTPHLLHVFSNFVATGPEVRTVRVIEALGPRFRHSVISMDGHTEAAELLTGAAQVELLDAPEPKGSLGMVRQLRERLRTIRPDALVTYNWGSFDAVMAGRSLGWRNILHHEEGFNADEAESFKARRVWPRRLFLPGVSRVIVPSSVLDRVATETWKLPKDKLRLIPNGVELSQFPRRDGNVALRAELGIPETAFVVGFVARLRPVKNPLRALNVIAKLKELGIDVHFLVVGDGPSQAELLSAAGERGLSDRVHSVGHQAVLSPYYRTMDAFLLTSDSEQMPVALVEAMASGVPPVSTEVGDVAHIVAPESRDAVIPLGPDCVAGLAQALEQLALDTSQRSLLGLAAHAKVQRDYSFAVMIDAYGAEYTAACRARA